MGKLVKYDIATLFCYFVALEYLNKKKKVSYLNEFVMLTLIHVLAVMSPGADFAVVVRQSVSFGRKTAIITSCGIALGISVHIAYTLLGVGFIISQSPILFLVMKVIGASYLAYMALHLVKSQPQKRPKNVELDFDSHHHKKAFMVGFMTNVLNPKVTIFFLAIFTTVVSVDTPLLIQAGYGAWIILLTACWFILVSSLFSLKKVRNKFVTHGYLFERAMGFVLLFFSIEIFYTVLTPLLEG
jgi:RhtB (resistance to homoserine/threonine) family protein